MSKALKSLVSKMIPTIETGPDGIRRVKRTGKITQDDIDSYIVAESRLVPGKIKHFIGGLCEHCGEPFVHREYSRRNGKFEWYVSTCDCGDRRVPDKEKQRNYLLKVVCIPERFIDCETKSIDMDINQENVAAFDAAKMYIRYHLYRQEGLILHGDVGTGKTMFACMILKYLFTQVGKACLYVKMSALIDNIINTKGSYLNIISQYDVILLDDIDKTGNEYEVSAWVREQRFSLFDMIASKKIILIATGNFKKIEDLENLYGPAILSRINGMCESILFRGNDYRQKEKEGRKYIIQKDLIL